MPQQSETQKATRADKPEGLTERGGFAPSRLLLLKGPAVFLSAGTPSHTSSFMGDTSKHTTSSSSPGDSALQLSPIGTIYFMVPNVPGTKADRP